MDEKPKVRKKNNESEWKPRLQTHDPACSDTFFYFKGQCNADIDGEPKIKRMYTRSMDVDSIYKLNDDCLRQIFSYLSKRQLIGIERGDNFLKWNVIFFFLLYIYFFPVCKKWKEISLTLWSNVTELNFDKLKEITENKQFHDLNVKEFKSIIVRCGQYLEVLDFGYHKVHDMCKTKGDAVIELICQYCENLKRLDLTGMVVSEKRFNQRAHPSLESFAFKGKNLILGNILCICI